MTTNGPTDPYDGRRASGDHIEAVDYVMDALDADQQRAADAHLATCEICRAEVDALAEGVAVLAQGLAPQAPPPAMRDSLLSRISQIPQDAPPVDPAEGTAPRPVTDTSQTRSGAAGRHRAKAGSPRKAMLFGLAAAVLVGGAVVGVTRPWVDDGQQPITASAVRSAPDARTETAAAAGRRLEVITSAELDRSVANFHGPAAPAGQIYQAWFITAGGPVSAGEMSPDSPTVMTPVAGTTAVAITIEPAGGSQAPTTTPIVNVALS